MVKNKNNSKENPTMKEIVSFARILLMCFVLVFLINNLFTRHVVVEGNSMWPTLHNEEEGFTNIFSVLFLKDINRFDIVVVKGKDTNTDWIKRIIGLPGEEIVYKNDELFINGKYVEEPFLDEVYVKEVKQQNHGVFTENFGPIVLGEDEYFLMGDNRIVSHDSRAVGCFGIHDIESKSLFVLQPFKKFRYVVQ
ncbi:MAG: signal peptidase I [Breznakia sp.]